MRLHVGLVPRSRSGRAERPVAGGLIILLPLKFFCYTTVTRDRYMFHVFSRASINSAIENAGFFFLGTGRGNEHIFPQNHE